MLPGYYEDNRLWSGWRGVNVKDRQGIARCSEAEGLLFEKRVFALGREKALNEDS